jgi:D-alanine--D-alanine ligase
MDIRDKHVAVVRGGPSSEYELSLKTGNTVILALEKLCHVHDVFIDRQGTWHRRGIPATPEKALQGVDVAFNATHGTFGEDGQIQKIFSSLGVPYIGPDAFASALTVDRAKAKETLKKIPHVRMPQHHVVAHYEGMHYGEKSQEIFTYFGPPYIVKALHGGTHKEVRVAKHLKELPHAIKHVAGALPDDVLVEQYEKGVHVSCACISQFRNKRLYTTVPADETFEDGVIVSASAPSSVTAVRKGHIEAATEYIHEQLGLTHVSESHFIVTPHSIFYTHTTTSPALGEHSPLVASLTAVGSSLNEYLLHILHIAETTRRYS